VLEFCYRTGRAMQTAFRNLPSVDRLVSDRRLVSLAEFFSRPLVLETTRQVLEESRVSISRGEPPPNFDVLVRQIDSRVRSTAEPSLVPVVNATGVILHTNIGRAPLSSQALAAMEAASRGYDNLELDLDTGRRGSRQVHVTSLLCRLTGAEAALMVNNNASGVLLALSALARRKEVIISRGQAIEIGGSFRIPDVMRQSGAKLVEVGTTNCTYIADYEQAITPRTAALLRVHSSNFKIVGFTQEVMIEELVGLARQHDLLVLDDLGSGCLLDTAQYGLEPEPTVQASIEAGVDLAFMSGDKLLGGPQAGLIVGRKALVDRLKKHPLARAVRTDKVRLAGMEASLLHYLKGEAEQCIPIWKMVSTPLAEIESRARSWAQEYPGVASVIQGHSVVGGGSLPGSTLPTWLLAVRLPGRGRSASKAQKLARALRGQNPPVVARIEDDTLLIDPRTVFPEDDRTLIAALHRALEEAGVA